jgi:hypothetical protein
VKWTLASEPATLYRLEFYAGDACDRPDESEATTYLGTTNAITDPDNGNANGSTPLALAGASHVSMTATRLSPRGVLPNLTMEPTDTSELSACTPVQ